MVAVYYREAIDNRVNAINNTEVLTGYLAIWENEYYRLLDNGEEGERVEKAEYRIKALNRRYGELTA